MKLPATRSDGAPFRLARRPVALALMAAFAAGAWADPNALPTGGQVAAGSAAISTAGNRMTVQQSSDRAIVNWATFNVGANAGVQFVQPGASAVILNRVADSGGASQILGSLSANGQVFLLNPNGVLFGRGAQVDVGGLLASSMRMSDADFLSGRVVLERGGATGAVINQGTILAKEGGYVALLAPEVRNEGVIGARLGTVALAAGEKMTLDFAGDRLVRLAIDEAALSALVENKHVIRADGGLVLLAARAAGDLASTVVNNEGLIQAMSVSERNGVVTLDGGERGIVSVAGTIDATGRAVGETGGRIAVLGDRVGVMSGARLDASGDAGGGTILVGGNYQGKGSERNATVTYLGPDASVKADAITNGNGGTVVFWSDDTTRAQGTISVRGGAEGGDGGLAEVSGKLSLTFEADVDRAAPNGRAGTLLLDPTNLSIVTGTASTNVSGASPFAPATASGSTIGWNNINTALAGGAVTVQTTTGFNAGQAGDITIAGAGTLTSGNALTITAAGGITQNAGATITRSVAGALNLNATAGTVTLNDNITLTNSAITVTSAAFNQAAGTINTGSGLLTLSVTGASSQAAGAVIAGTGGLTKSGAGTLTLAGTNTNTGATTVSAGSLALSGGAAIADTSALNLGTSGANLTLNANETVGSIAGVAGTTVTLNANTLTSGGNNGNTTLASVVSGTGGMTKLGTGTLTVSGANTYTGATTVTAGTIAAGNDAAFGTGTVVLNGGTVSAATAARTFANAVSLAANSTLGGTLGMTFNGTLTNTMAGNPTLTVSNTAATTLGGTVNLSNSATSRTLIVAGTGDLTISGDIVNGGTATASAVVKTGTGTLTLAGNNSYAGGTTATAGTLAAGSNTAFGTATLTLNGGTVAASGGARTLANAASLAASSTIGGSSALTISGKLTNTLAGNPTLTVSNTALTTLGAVDLSNSATSRTLTVAGAGDVTINGVVANGSTSTAGALTMSGSGSLTLAGANTYGGATTISSGRVIAGNATALGTTGSGTTVSSGATLEIKNGTALGAEGLTLNGTGVGGNGALVVTAGSASASGAITVASTSSIGGDGTLTLSGNVNAQTAGVPDLSQAGTGTLTFNGTVGATNALASFTTSAGQTTNLGGGQLRTTGAQTYGGKLATTAATTLTSTASGAITANDTTNSFSGNLALQTGGAASVTSAGALALGASSTGTLTARTLSGNLTVNGALSASGSGNALVLAAAGELVNNVGSGALSTPSGRWLAYMASPSGSTENGLTGAAGSSLPRLYGRTYAGNAPASITETGNHLIYSTQPTLTVTPDDKTKTYGANDPTQTYTVTGYVSDDGVTDNATAAGLSGSLGRSVGENVGSYAFAAGNLASGAGYGISVASGKALTINAAPLTVALSTPGQTKVYGADDPALSGIGMTLTGLINNASISTWNGTVSVNDSAVTGTAASLTRAAGENVGNYAITAGSATLSASGSNYSQTFSTSNSPALSITAKALTAGIASQTKVYGESDPVVSAATVTGLVNRSVSNWMGGNTAINDSALASTASSISRTAGEDVAGGPYAYTAASFSAPSANYGTPVFSGSPTLTITPASLLITARDAERLAGDPNPPFGATVSGLVRGDRLSSLGGQLGYDTPATVSAAPGSYSVTPFGLSSSNYRITYVAGTLRVNRATLPSGAIPSPAVNTVATPPSAPTPQGAAGQLNSLPATAAGEGGSGDEVVTLQQDPDVMMRGCGLASPDEVCKAR